MVDELGPLVDAPIPAFSLLNDAGNAVTVREVLDKKGAVLAFIHGTWCPTCVQTLYQFQRHVDDYAEREVGVAVVAVDPVHQLHVFKLSTEQPMPFTFLSDADGAVHEQYHLAHAAAYLVVDDNATLKQKYVDPDHHSLPGQRTLLEAVDSVLG